MNQPKIAPLLRQILRPETWCQGDFAVDINGKTIEPDSSLACKFCILGAVNKIRRDQKIEGVFMLTWQAVHKASNGETDSAAIFNDRATSFDQIKTFLDEYEKLEQAQCNQ